MTLIINTLYFLLFSKDFKASTKALIFPTIILIIVIISFNFNAIIESLPNNVKLYVYRYFGAFFDIKGSYYVDQKVIYNEHFEESQFAYENAVKNLSFWGDGYGTQEFGFLYKASTGIHNAYIAVWKKFGFFALLYYVYILLMILSNFVKTILKKWNRKDNLLSIKILMSIFLLLLFLSAWTSILQNFIGIKMVVIRSLLLVALFKIPISNIKLSKENIN